MIVEYQNSFRDLKKRKDRNIGAKVTRLVDLAKDAPNLGTFKDIKPITDYAGYYRIRIGVYRVGIFVQGDRVTFIRVLPRPNFYRSFP